MLHGIDGKFKLELPIWAHEKQIATEMCDLPVDSFYNKNAVHPAITTSTGDPDI